MDQSQAKHAKVVGTAGVESTDPSLANPLLEAASMVDSDPSAKAPAFQFYPKDFLTDEHVRLMSLQERGAYITLLCQCWTEGTLPADSERLARLCGVPSAAFRKLWPALEPCFRPASREDNRLVHPRLERERQKQRAYRKKQAENGKKGGRPITQDKPTANPILSQSGFPKESSAFASSSSSASAEENKIKSTAASRRPVENSEGTFGLYVVIAKEALANSLTADSSDSIGNVAEHFKTLCAQRGLSYSGELSARAIASVMRESDRQTA